MPRQGIMKQFRTLVDLKSYIYILELIGTCAVFALHWIGVMLIRLFTIWVTVTLALGITLGIILLILRYALPVFRHFRRVFRISAFLAPFIFCFLHYGEFSVAVLVSLLLFGSTSIPNWILAMLLNA
jgi:hypothetical protein